MTDFFDEVREGGYFPDNMDFDDVGGLCPHCGYGMMLHREGKCPDDVGLTDCPYCGSKARFVGWTDTSPSTWTEGWECMGDCGRGFAILRSEGDGFWGFEDEQEKDPILTDDHLNARDKGRLRKALDRQYRYLGEVSSLRELLERMGPTRKSKRTRKYARRKRQGCYAELKNPVTEYTVWFDDDHGMLIPKMVWDALDVPEK